MCEEGLQVEEVTHDLKQSLRVWFGRFASVYQMFSLCRAEKDHYVFWWIQYGKRILLVVYVDYIMIIGNDTKRIDSMKQYLQKYFQTKDLETLKYSSIEVVKSKKGIIYHRGSMHLTCF